MADLHVFLDGAAVIYQAERLPAEGETIDLGDGVLANVDQITTGADGEPLILASRKTDAQGAAHPETVTWIEAPKRRSLTSNGLTQLVA